MFEIDIYIFYTSLVFPFLFLPVSNEDTIQFHNIFNPIILNYYKPIFVLLPKPAHKNQQILILLLINFIGQNCISNIMFVITLKYVS